MTPVRGHLPAAARGIVRSADRLQQMLVRRHAERERQRTVAVVEIEPVGGRTEVPGNGDLDPFVPRARDLEEDLVLPLELDLLVVRAACRQHRPVHVQQRLTVECRGASGFLCRFRFGCHALIAHSEGKIRPDYTR